MNNIQSFVANNGALSGAVFPAKAGATSETAKETGSEKEQEILAGEGVTVKEDSGASLGDLNALISKLKATYELLLQNAIKNNLSSVLAKLTETGNSQLAYIVEMEEAQKTMKTEQTRMDNADAQIQQQTRTIKELKISLDAVNDEITALETKAATHGLTEKEKARLSELKDDAATIKGNIAAAEKTLSEQTAIFKEAKGKIEAANTSYNTAYSKLSASTLNEIATFLGISNELKMLDSINTDEDIEETFERLGIPQSPADVISKVLDEHSQELLDDIEKSRAFVV